MLNRTTKSWTILAGIAFATSFGALSAAYAQDDDASAPPPPPPPPPAASAPPATPDSAPAPGGPGGRRRGGPRFTLGTVTEVSANEFLVKPSFGTSLVSVTTTSDTHYNVVTTEKVTDLKVGDKVLVMAQFGAAAPATSSTSITARSIMVGDMPNLFQRPGGRRAGGGGGFGGPPPGAAGGRGGGAFTPPINGTIASVSPLKVTGSDGKTYTVTTTDTTTISLHQPGAVSDLSVGKFVMVMPVRPEAGAAPPADTGTAPTSVTAESVTIAPSQAALGMMGGGRGGRRFGGGGGGFGGGGGGGFSGGPGGPGGPPPDGGNGGPPPPDAPPPPQ